ncbi:MAG TPA: class I lanthipeptide [Chitinophaga sp.]|uniref:class I lanthipeptide n=1 Tax=Chitinophaga sp. TaxID=1869181 RepID=UPI002BF852CD|nr:class I lanthipeptide [Chitinophaga sp.]HVI44834.1 class I lanthipeptide [Chitinophaga sp.]
MKKKNFNRDLSLNRETIAQLSLTQLNFINGGELEGDTGGKRCSKKCCYSGTKPKAFEEEETEEFEVEFNRSCK